MQEEPPSLRTEREGGQEFFWLFVRPSRILFVRKEGLFAEPFVCEPRPLGLGKVAGRAPEPPHVARGRSGVPLAFCTTLALPFRSEGGVEHARLPSVGASGDVSGELLSGKSEWRPVPHSIGSASGPETRSKKVPEGFSSGCQGRSIGPRLSVPPYGGIPFRELLLVSDTT